MNICHSDGDDGDDDDWCTAEIVIDRGMRRWNGSNMMDVKKERGKRQMVRWLVH